MKYLQEGTDTRNLDSNGIKRQISHFCPVAAFPSPPAGISAQGYPYPYCSTDNLQHIKVFALHSSFGGAQRGVHAGDLVYSPKTPSGK